MSGIAAILIIWMDVPFFTGVQALVATLFLFMVAYQFGTRPDLQMAMGNSGFRPLLGPLILTVIVASWGFIQILPLHLVGQDSFGSEIGRQGAEALGLSLPSRITMSLGGTIAALQSLFVCGALFVASLVGTLRFGADRTLRGIFYAIGLTAALSLLLFWGQALGMAGSDFVAEGPRLRGPLAFKNEFAAFLGFGLILGAFHILSIKTPAVSDGHSNGTILRTLLVWAQSRWLEICGVISVALAFPLTESRGASLVLLIALITGMAVWFVARSKASPATPVLWFKALGPAALGVLILTVIATGMVSKFSRVGVDDRGRSETYEMTQSAIEQNWLAGTGMGSFEDAISLYQSSPGPSPVHAHNDYLETILTFGLPAALLAFGLFAWLNALCLKGLTRNADRPYALLMLMITVLLGVHSMIDHPAQSTAVLASYFAVLGACLGQTLLSKTDE